jgi:hypothetical protein
MKRRFLFLAMLGAAAGGFAQKAALNKWAYGLEASYNAAACSLSFQTMFPYGGWSVDFIHRSWDENSGEVFGGINGFRGSLFLGIPIGAVFELYGGGGVGFEFSAGGGGFVWKVDGGALAWLLEILYVKARITYDSIREFAVTAGVGYGS